MLVKLFFLCEDCFAGVRLFELSLLSSPPFSLCILPNLKYKVKRNFVYFADLCKFFLRGLDIAQSVVKIADLIGLQRSELFNVLLWSPYGQSSMFDVRSSTLGVQLPTSNVQLPTSNV